MCVCVGGVCVRMRVICCDVMCACRLVPRPSRLLCGKSLSLSPVRLAISLRLGQRRSTERVSNFSHRYHRTRGFICRHYDARLKNRFPYLEVR